MPRNEEEELRSVTIQNAKSIMLARQRAEQELLRAKQELERRTQEQRATLQATWDGILVTDAEGKVTDFNPSYLAMWRLSPDVMDTMDHRRILQHLGQQFENSAQFVARIEEIYAESPDESLDVLEMADGRVFERYSTLRVLDGAHAGRVWSFRDISQSRRAEEALRDETRILERLNRTGMMLSSELDLQTLVQAVTDAATELTGAKFGAFFHNVTNATGDAFMLYTLSGARREDFAGFGQPRATAMFGPTFRGEAPIRCDDVSQDPRYGTMPPYRGMPPGHLAVRSFLAVPVVSRSGEVIGGLFFGHPEPGVFGERAERLVVGIAAQAAVAIDNARLFAALQKAAEERTQLLESERIARAQAERASGTKDEFLATLSHELRTPLNAILGWSQILRVRAMSEAQLNQGLEIIERNARMQTQLVEDLLDMSRITSGKMRLDVQPVSPIAFIDAAIETVRPTAEAKGIRLTKLLDPAAGPIIGDPSRLQQVVWNLLSNAIKFTGKSGRVEIVLARVNSQVEITVADSGIGIKPEFLPHVFDRFRQEGASATNPAGGLGLGLSIVRHLVEQHGGTVQAMSPGEGRGATFTIHLPLTVVHRSADGEERLHPRGMSAGAAEFKRLDLSGIKVLVVDDQEDARELIKRVLQECDAEVVTAGTAHEALAAVEAERPDILVSDIGMPDVDGYELLRRVRTLGPAKGGRLPAIALTAFARSEDRTRALHAGYLVHVSKPIEPSELVATVASIVGRTGVHFTE